MSAVPRWRKRGESSFLTAHVVPSSLDCLSRQYGGQANYSVEEDAMQVATAGQLIRILGLLCELLGMGGILFVSSRGAGAFPPILGQDPDTVFKGLVIGGFVLWLTGRTMIAMFRSRESRRDRDESGQGANDLRL
jgi:hypothetical protein